MAILTSFQFGQCEYCKNDIDKRTTKSSWSETEVHHYKSLTCAHCERKIWMRVRFSGSGHDNTLERNAHVGELEFRLRCMD